MTEPKPKGRPPERIVTTINFKTALSTPPQVETLFWPKNWPIPEQGDQVGVGELIGTVVNRTFYPVTGILVINAR